MLREGPIPLFAHALLEYAAGALLILAPFLLGFDDGGAVAVSIAAGVVVLVVAASSESPVSLVDQIPIAAHVALDYVMAVVLIALPFIAAFSDETAPTAFFIALGVVHLLVTIGTRFRRPAER
jgi:hypothetical protein